MFHQYLNICRNSYGQSREFSNVKCNFCSILYHFLYHFLDVNGISRELEDDSSSSTSISTDSIWFIIDKLKRGRICDPTLHNYYNVWKLFNRFLLKLDRKPNNWEDRLTLFVGYLVEAKKKSQMIKSYISVIKAVLKDVNVDVDVNEDKYLIASLTRACKIRQDVFIQTLPIQKGLMGVIIKKTQECFLAKQQHYLSVLYRALFSTMYYGLFRVGEVTSGSHPVQVKDVYIGENKKKFQFILRTSKTHQRDSKPQKIKIKSCEKTLTSKRKVNENHWCPFQLLYSFAKLRRKYLSPTEPFFVFADNTPVRPHHMREVLKAMISFAGMDASNYCTMAYGLGEHWTSLR